MFHRLYIMATKEFWVAAPRWVLVACISGLIFLCGILTQQVRDLRSKNEVYQEELQKVRLRAIEDDTKADIARLKQIATDHAVVLDHYWVALDKNSDAILALSRQVERLANETRRRNATGS